MFCAKCGKEIPDGERKVCEECEKDVLETPVAEEVITEKPKKEKKEKSGKKFKVNFSGKKELIKKVVVGLVAIVVVVLLVMLLGNLTGGNNAGNTIGNVRNYGYAVEDGNWIYYLSPNEDSSEIGIFKIKNN